MKYYLDEDISPTVAVLLRKKGVDTKSSHEVGMNGHSDLVQLETAYQEGRCFVTRNRNDFILLTIRFFNEQRLHLGVLIVPYTLPAYPFSRLANALADYAKAQPKGMESYRIDFVTAA